MKKSNRNNQKTKKRVVNRGGVRSRRNRVRNDTAVAPVAMATQQKSLSPKYSSVGKTFCVKHKEFITSLNGSPGYSVKTFNLQPGLGQTFPWLSNIAQNFEQYRFKQLKFHYVTRSGTNQQGSVIMCMDYDASDTPPTAEQVQTAYEGATEDSLWKPSTMSANLNSLHAPGTRKWIRTAATTPNADIKLYDSGFFIFGTTGCADSSMIGKLWVSYEVEFFTPQLAPMGTTFYGAVECGVLNQTLATWGNGPYFPFGNLQVVVAMLPTSTFSTQMVTLTFPVVMGYTYLVQINENWLTPPASILPSGGSPNINLAYIRTVADFADYSYFLGGTAGWYYSNVYVATSSGIATIFQNMSYTGVGPTLFSGTVVQVVGFAQATGDLLSAGDALEIARLRLKYDKSLAVSRVQGRKQDAKKPSDKEETG